MADAITAVRNRLDHYFEDLRGQAARYGDADEIVDALHGASAGGKSLRPELVLRVHAALGGTAHTAAIDIAAAFELLHTALIIHDDLIDHDWTRRGMPNVSGRYRSKASASGVSTDDATHYGISVGIVAGDLILAGAIRLVAMVRVPDDRRLQLLRLIDDAVVASAVGELADIKPRSGRALTAAQVARTHRAKTAVYTFEAPLQAGAVLAGATPAVTELLGTFGRHVGTAYQILDDIAGVLGEEQDTGKAAGTDIRSGKQTAIVVAAQAGPAWNDIRHLFGKADLTTAELAYARARLVKCGAIAAAENQAAHHLQWATMSLNEMPSALRLALIPLLAMVANSR